MIQALYAGGTSPPLINAAPASGVSATVNVAGFRTYGLQVVLTGSPTGAVVTLALSNDGVTFFTVTTWTVASQTSGDILFAVDKPAMVAKVSLTTLSGGTAPTASIYLSAV